MKMDVEGFEPFVVDGARRTLRERPPRVVLTEYTPGVVESREAFARAPRYPRSLQVLPPPPTPLTPNPSPASSPWCARSL